jgi:hypothetical protein
LSLNPSAVLGLEQKATKEMKGIVKDAYARALSKKQSEQYSFVGQPRAAVPDAKECIY